MKNSLFAIWLVLTSSLLRAQSLPTGTSATTGQTGPTVATNTDVLAAKTASVQLTGGVYPVDGFHYTTFAAAFSAAAAASSGSGLNTQVVLPIGVSTTATQVVFPDATGSGCVNIVGPAKGAASIQLTSNLGTTPFFYKGPNTTVLNCNLSGFTIDANANSSVGFEALAGRGWTLDVRVKNAILSTTSPSAQYILAGDVGQSQQTSTAIASRTSNVSTYTLTNLPSTASSGLWLQVSGCSDTSFNSTLGIIGGQRITSVTGTVGGAGTIVTANTGSNSTATGCTLTTGASTGFYEAFAPDLQADVDTSIVSAANRPTHAVYLGHAFTDSKPLNILAKNGATDNVYNGGSSTILVGGHAYGSVGSTYAPTYSVTEDGNNNRYFGYEGDTPATANFHITANSSKSKYIGVEFENNSGTNPTAYMITADSGATSFDVYAPTCTGFGALSNPIFYADGFAPAGSHIYAGDCGNSFFNEYDGTRTITIGALHGNYTNGYGYSQPVITASPVSGGVPAYGVQLSPGAGAASAPPFYFQASSGGANEQFYRWAVQYDGSTVSPSYQVSIGSVVASATSIALTKGITHVSGTAFITSLSGTPGMMAAAAPLPAVGGCFQVIADGAWSTGTTGNISTAIQAVVGQRYEFCNDGVTWQVNPLPTFRHQLLWNIQPGTSVTLNTTLGAIYLEDQGATIRAVTARLSGTTTCTVAPQVAILDLGTSPTTVYGSATVLNNVTTGTTANGYSQASLSTLVPIGHYVGFGFSAGNCTVSPTFDVVAEMQ